MLIWGPFARIYSHTRNQINVLTTATATTNFWAQKENVITSPGRLIPNSFPLSTSTTFRIVFDTANPTVCANRGLRNFGGVEVIHEVLSVMPQPCLIPAFGNFLESFWIISGESGAAPVLNWVICSRLYCPTNESLTRRIRIATELSASRPMHNYKMRVIEVYLRGTSHSSLVRYLTMASSIVFMLNFLIRMTSWLM